MSEERTQYTVHPDVLVRLETSEKHIKQLESTNDGLTMVMGRHRETMRKQAERIAELEATVAEATERISYLKTTNSMRRTTIEEQTARIAELEQALADVVPDVLQRIKRQNETIARLEADNRRLRHLDAMPVDAMRRLVANSEWSGNEDYTAGQYVCDYNDTMKFFRDVDGAA